MIWNREPVAIVNAVRLVILAGVSLGLSLEPGQIVTTMAALEAVLTLLARQQVTPNETVEEEIDMVHRIADLQPRDVPILGNPDDGQANVTGALWAVLLVLAIVVLLRVLGVL